MVESSKTLGPFGSIGLVGPVKPVAPDELVESNGPVDLVGSLGLCKLGGPEKPVKHFGVEFNRPSGPGRADGLLGTVKKKTSEPVKPVRLVGSDRPVETVGPHKPYRLLGQE